MNKETSLFFIALLPPPEIQEYVTQIKQYFADRYRSRAALKSPPHITLQPPFEWAASISTLEEYLGTFASGKHSVPVTLEGFSAFPPRVIYVNVLKTEQLLALQADLIAQMEKLGVVNRRVSKTRPYAPHITVAFRDLTKQNFKVAWSEFEFQQLHFEFTATQLTLLVHDGRRWNIGAEFPFLV